MPNKKWDNKQIEQLIQRRQIASIAGSEERIAKQHSAGKLTARERINKLFDFGTFTELNDLVESRIIDFNMGKKITSGDGVVTGYGKINSRLVFAASQDFTVSGGSLGEYQAIRICKVMDKAVEMGVPFVSINDSGGARIEEGLDSLSGYSSIFLRNTHASGVIPQIAAIMGPCAGGACYSPAICDFIFMTDKNAQMYITGPQVVKTVTGEIISSSELGGTQVHMEKSGVAHFSYTDDESCLHGIRDFLSYLPQNYLERPPIKSGKPVDRSSELQQIVPDDKSYPYDVKQVIGTFVDQNSFVEIQRDFALNIVIGIARFDGETVGIVANQPNFMAGSLDYHASYKAARFVRFCDCFNIPIITLVDVPAFLPGSEQEYNGIIRHGAKLLFAYAEATVPKISLVMRKAYGGAYLAMNSKNIGADIVYAWPIAEMAVMGADGAVNIIFRRDIDTAENKETARSAYIRDYEKKFLNPYKAAERGYVDEVILPEESRVKIAFALEMLKTKKKSIPAKKHGNIPL
ncbi:MAG: acyl-CoA carboxylase subunit beta [Flexilinea sp.]